MERAARADQEAQTQEGLCPASNYEEEDEKTRHAVEMKGTAKEEKKRVKNARKTKKREARSGTLDEMKQKH
jgi:hypothetical protein